MISHALTVTKETPLTLSHKNITAWHIYITEHTSPNWQLSLQF